jgi:hypothetical protein
VTEVAYTSPLERLGNPALGTSEPAARGDRSAAGEAAVLNVERGFSGMQFIENFVPGDRIRIFGPREAWFFFTPGVPRELRRMLEEQIIPRLLARSGAPTAIHLKRIQSYGLGESHVDQLLAGVEELVPDGSVKLGFRTHYPQIETKLTVRGANMADIEAKLAPVQEEVRWRLYNFIIAEDDQTLEGASSCRARGLRSGSRCKYC